MQENKRRSGLKIMGSLIGLVRPLIWVMLLAILLGTLGHLCAISLTVIAGTEVNNILADKGSTVFTTLNAGAVCRLTKIGTGTMLVIMVAAAVLRGILHYAEQYCNHFIAFRILAIIRHKVFAKLRELCPAKLDGKENGNLIAVITSDIELLEVFYAHTISPIAIAFLTSLIMVIFIGNFHPADGVIAFIAYVTAGIIVPVWNGRLGAEAGLKYRNSFGELNSYVLESLRGIDETIQYERGEEREKGISSRSIGLGKLRKDLSKREGSQRALNTLVILVFSFGMLFTNIYLYSIHEVSGSAVIIATIAMMSSFGPVTALSNLSNNLNQTLASGERILSLMEEDPLVEEVGAGDDGSASVRDMENADASADNVTFSYDGKEEILSDYSVNVPAGKITGIHGRSGSGKSTLLKLFMRFRDVDKGKIALNGTDIKEIPTEILRRSESFVTQETDMFHDTIANNIRIAKEDATDEEVIEAAKKASVHDFIMSLPDGYDTVVGESGSTLSGGEKQRIGLARAFLHDAPFILLDEPTSNLDSLNESIILRSLRENQKQKTILLVSHRKSTMKIADETVEMEE